MAFARSSSNRMRLTHRDARHDAQLVPPPEEAAELVKKAMRLSPIHSAWYLAVPAHADRLMLRYDEAIEVYKQSIALAPNQIAAHWA
jgi:tetratricopeptide (TPR) repeat protein